MLLLSASVLFAAISVFPAHAAAQSISTQTQQLLPLGPSTCGAVVATDFTPYIYDGALHSFEFSLPDPSYVAIIGTVGDASIPFQVMTRKVSSAGVLRVHVDTPTTPVTGTLPIVVTLLSARQGQPVCAAIVSMSVGSGPVVVKSPVKPIVQKPVPIKKPISISPPRPVPPKVPSTPKSPSVPSTTTVPAKATTTVTSATSVVSTVQSQLRSICASDTSAYRLWLILLVLYALIVGVALWAEFPMSLPWARTPERVATIILVLLLLLLGFWYFSVSCRAALWMPLVAFLIAVLGLLAAFWNHPRVTQLLLIQETKVK